MGVNLWSKTAASNATSDPAINWRDNQAPSNVKANGRSDMAAIASWRDDISGLLLTTGTSTAYSVTTNQSNTSLVDGLILGFTPHVTNGAAATISIDGLTAVPLRLRTGVAIPSGVLSLGTPYVCVYNLAANEVRVHGYVTEQAAIPIGAMTPYIGTTAPSSLFVFPYGQAISRTTYATLFALTGTAFGVGDGSTTFNVPDLRGRSIYGVDNMGGTTAGRVTSAGSGITGTTLGAAGGTETVTLARANLPNVTLGTDVQGSHSHTYGLDNPLNAASGGAASIYGGGGNYTTSAAGAHSHTTTSINGNVTQTAVNKMSPAMMCNYILRVI